MAETENIENNGCPLVHNVHLSLTHVHHQLTVLQYVKYFQIKKKIMIANMVQLFDILKHFSNPIEILGYK